MDAMARLHKNSIRVTDIAGQYWCELQMELYHIHGRKITDEIKKGKAIHATLESESNVPVTLEPRTYADYMYKELYTAKLAIDTLHRSKLTREVKVYGSVNGYRLSGKIDQLEMNEGAITIVENKTRTNNKVPSDSQVRSGEVQLMFYRKMVGDIQDGSYSRANFHRNYGTDKLAISDSMTRQLIGLGVSREMQRVGAIADSYFDSMAGMGKASDDLKIRYVNQFSGELIKMYTFRYEDKNMAEIMNFVMKYWRGEREALPVPETESWKCNFCVFFGKECRKWWKEEDKSA